MTGLWRWESAWSANDVRIPGSSRTKIWELLKQAERCGRGERVDIEKRETAGWEEEAQEDGDDERDPAKGKQAQGGLAPSAHDRVT